MMSKKKWVLLLMIFIIYLFLGACFFYKIESEHEQTLREEARDQRNEILDLLNKSYPKDDLLDLLDKLGTYCGKTLINITKDHFDEPPKWDFYHSVFFSFTVVTTVGYGNLAPTLTISRMFMILYAIIGIPYNGILYATLGEYFGRTFIKLYKKWKNSRVGKNSKDLSKLGFVGQVLLYLLPGITIFIFIPAIFFKIFEDWEYDLAVYYAFVTLTTIGFGDYVAGMNRYNHGFGVYFLVYQICILIWMTIGLGYLVMVIGFLTRGLRSKKITRLEKIVKQNIKNTHAKIWSGFTKDVGYLRRLMNELYMAKFKPVYKDEVYVSTTLPKTGSQSFPDLRLLCSDSSPTTLRRRAMSECQGPPRPLIRTQSDTDLTRIDKDATFALAAAVQPSELLAKVVDALSQTEEAVDELSDHDDFEELGIHGFSDSEILRSEMFGGSGWSLGNKSIGANSIDKPAVPPKVLRTRAASDVKIPIIRPDNSFNEWTWSGPAATKTIQELRAKTKFSRPRVRTNSEDTQSSTKSWLEKFRNSFRRKATDQVEEKVLSDFEKQKQDYLEKTARGRRSAYSIEERNRSRSDRASVFSVPESKVLEETTVADLLRALTSLHSRVATIPEVALEPQRKMGNAGLIPSKMPSSLDIFSPPSNARLQMRRSSMTPNMLTRRRFSLHPVHELPSPPPYNPAISALSHGRRGSLKPTTTTATPGLVHKQITRLKENENVLHRRTRHDSLRDIRVDKL